MKCGAGSTRFKLRRGTRLATLQLIWLRTTGKIVTDFKIHLHTDDYYGSAMELDPKSPEVMTSFYQRLFPFKALHTWLSHSVSNPVGTTDNAGGIGNSTLGKGPVPAWTHREFAFTLQNDAYLRYLSFNDAEELKRQVLKLVPQRFEIGAIYNARVS